MTPPHQTLDHPAPYPVIHVPRDAPEKTEHVGSKEKFWFSRWPIGSHSQWPPTQDQTAEGEETWLFKAVRRRTTGALAGTYPDGDDWAERVAADLADLIGLPHATYEMAVHDDVDGPRPGIITRKLEIRSRLVEGNELLVHYAHVDGYPEIRDARRTVIRSYTPDLVLDTLTDLGVRCPPYSYLPEGVVGATAVFVGYLMLDALICNTDRHDQNWAVLEINEHLDHLLAPTYDHASSLGRELSDAKRAGRLTTTRADRDLSAYLSKPTSRFHDPSGRQISPFAAFERAARRHPGVAMAWLQRLDRVPASVVEGLLARVPGDRISPLGREFAARLVDSNRASLAALRASLP